jgi:hypothetical protein
MACQICGGFLPSSEIMEQAAVTSDLNICRQQMHSGVLDILEAVQNESYGLKLFWQVGLEG